MNGRRLLVSWWLVLLLAVVLHVDWHAGRPDHFRLSLAWPLHWVIGLVAGGALAFHARRAWPDRYAAAVLANGVVAVLLGQGIEPLLEVLFYGEPFAVVLPLERWRIFIEFAAAGFGGALAVALLTRRRAARGGTVSLAP